MDPLYREIILEHWQHPQNYRVVDEPDFDVEEFNPLCGDMIRLTGKIKNGKLMEIAFIGEGCAISKASASLFTEEIKGKSLESIKKIKEKNVLDLLGIELTPARTKCALLVYNSFKKAQKNYEK
jgi:nitrogen fixation protein NifU and related proteins